MPRSNSAPRRICFVTGTRAEFGLMRTVLHAVQSHRNLQLQIIATGMHLSKAHGRSLNAIKEQGWKIDQIVRWKDCENPSQQAEAMGLATAALAGTFAKLKSDVVLVVGDRVEAFAAAAAAHASQKIVAHVHGGDRAIGQIDDSLRHAITKLSHLHFPATAQSAQRIARLGEDQFRISLTGSPGLDEIVSTAADSTEISKKFAGVTRHRFALIVLHPIENNPREFLRAKITLAAVQACGVDQIVIIYPNNDPGFHHIVKCWNENRRAITHLMKNVSRELFLGLMRDAAMLIGNSSSGIIEAASFGTPVVNIGARQQGRERSSNVLDVDYSTAKITQAIREIWDDGNPRRFRGKNIYGGNDAGRRIAQTLATIQIDDQLRRKLIAY